MKQGTSIFMMVFILLMAGCNSDDTIKIEEQQKQLKELEAKIVDLEEINKEQRKIIEEQNKEFSYIKDFTKEELEAYEQFVQDKDAQHLLGLSPEKILLIYYHLIVIDDVEAIYSLTYDDGTLPDLSTFRENYYKNGLHLKWQDSTIYYRYYNSIKVKEDHKNENEVVVEMTVNLGSNVSTIVYGLKKEKGIWKMDTLHLMENDKDGNK
ncbi:hypothetical protein [Metabacillus litoralis]|uniref:hypothetical protein n=1 Tax=Metabacillus litoralis TaxID=152268 RepID=UPI001CFCFCEF|nr:hypothetical protein [Metabacillus litoralis]